MLLLLQELLSLNSEDPEVTFLEPFLGMQLISKVRSDEYPPKRNLHLQYGNWP